MSVLGAGAQAVLASSRASSEARPRLHHAGHGWLQWLHHRARSDPAALADTSGEVHLRKGKMLYRK